MNQPVNAARVARSQQIASVLKALDKEIFASCPDIASAQSVSSLYEVQAKRIASALEPLGEGAIESLAHAVFLDFSDSSPHREAAKRWFSEHAREAKKIRYVFDRFDGLSKLHRLKEAQAKGASTVPLATFPEIPEDENRIYSLHLDPESTQLLFTMPDIHGVFPPEIAEQVQRKLRNRLYIYLAFPPKCGGTFLRDAVGRASGAGPAPRRPGHALGGRDVSPYLPNLAAQMLSVTGPKAYITHAHMIAHHANIELLNLFKIKPVVMKRSIPDMLCSFSDMAQSEGRERDGSYNWSMLCGVHTDESFLGLDAEERAEFLICHQAPWYIQFYASWIRAQRNRRLSIHWVTFDEFRADPARAIVGILEFYGLDGRVKYVPAAIARTEANRAALRFNKGVSGRGADFLKQHHFVHLHRLAAGYPDIDFVAEGLLPPLPRRDTAEHAEVAFLAKGFAAPLPRAALS